MASSGDVSNIKIEPVELTWGNPETTRVKVTVAGGDGTSFDIFDKDGNEFYIWGDSGASVDPTPGGTGVTFSTAGSVSANATAMAAAIDAETEFNAKVDPCNSDEVIIQNVGVGATTASADNDSTYTLTQLRAGSKFDVGFTDGDIEIAMGEDLFDIQTNQGGSTIQDKIRTGRNIEAITIQMKESDAAKVKTILEASGASVTPGGGTEVSGVGNSKQFANISSDCRQLIMHPKRNAAANLSADWVFWRAYPNLSSFNFSGESDQQLGVEFTILPDPLIDAKVEQVAFGDHTQNLLRV